jgi:hypothetical protein
MLNLHIRLAAAAAISLLMSACGGGDDEDIETTTEQLRPTVTLCVTSDDCLYGYCSTEDGECGSAACPPGASSCAAVCYGSCIAAAPPQ